jgi:phosphoserine phosphatase
MRAADCGRVSWLALWLLLLLVGCATGPDRRHVSDLLLSWNEGPVKSAILSFLAAVDEPAGAGWVSPADRIAVFDHDGTLIIEKPWPVQQEFLFDRIRSLAADHPEWSALEPFRAILNNDSEQLGRLGYRDLAPAVFAAQSGMTEGHFAGLAADYVRTAADPYFRRPYRQLAYRPMVELIALLHARDFRVFIVSAGEGGFVRALSEETYGVPRERVIGSSAKTELREVDGRVEIWRKTGLGRVNAGPFKALNIGLQVGRRPVLAVGNADGDIEMMRYAEGGPSALVLLLRHDDAVREFEYQDDASRAESLARERGWQIVSMENDFRSVFLEAVPE